jgi:hypothetical protein
MLLESNYAIAEDVEARRWDQHYAQINYDEAILDRAEELSALFPDDVEMFAASNPNYASLLATDDAQDAYADFIDRICMDKAKAEWR